MRRRLASSDLAAVATFDINNGIRLVADFTDDRALLTHAIATLGVPSLSQITDPLGLAPDLLDHRPARPSATQEADGAPELLDDVRAADPDAVRADQQVYLHNVERLLEGLDGLAPALQGVEGRKQILYFSAGFDARLLVGELGLRAEAPSAERYPRPSLAGGQPWRASATAGCAASWARSPAASPPPTPSSTRSTSPASAATARSPRTAQPGHGRDTTNRESLGILRHGDGGRLFKDANDLDPALAEMLEMTSRYYVLGIQPDREKGPGTFHKLKVKVARKGVKLSHRPGYFETRRRGQGRRRCSASSTSRSSW